MKPSIEAVVLVAVCSRSHLPFGIRTERRRSKEWVLTWAFATNSQRSRREGYGDQELTGEFSMDGAYPGCPHCACDRIFRCQCSSIGCWDGSRTVTCAACKKTVTINSKMTSASSAQDH